MRTLAIVLVLLASTGAAANAQSFPAGSVPPQAVPATGAVPSAADRAGLLQIAAAARRLQSLPPGADWEAAEPELRQIEALWWGRLRPVYGRFQRMASFAGGAANVPTPFGELDEAVSLTESSSWYGSAALAGAAATLEQRARDVAAASTAVTLTPATPPPAPAVTPSEAGPAPAAATPTPQPVAAPANAALRGARPSAADRAALLQLAADARALESPAPDSGVEQVPPAIQRIDELWWGRLRRVYGRYQFASDASGNAEHLPSEFGPIDEAVSLLETSSSYGNEALVSAASTLERRVNDLAAATR